ncbi:MAG: thioredoxin [Candidatus Binatia bacterium]|nr:thioredoxin [Candidatus Binatia bacterium]
MEETVVIDVTDATFEAEVIEASHRVPIVVDFWAPWCGPCRTLGPLLEKLAAGSGGGFRLAKVDIDQNKVIAQALSIQSIPFVLAFRDGQVVNEFVGAQPESVVRQFIERILPDEADDLTSEGEALTAAGSAADAEVKFASALQLRPRHPRATLGLARVFAATNRVDEATELLQTVTASGELGVEFERLSAELRMQGTGAEDEATLRATLEANPKDLAAGLALGRLLASSGRPEEALAVFLEGVKYDRNFEDAAARKAMLDLFTLLGRENPIVDEYQAKLSQVIYS